MNNWSPNQILQRLNSDEFFRQLIDNEEFLNKLLDVRDQDEFDDAWVKAAEEIQALWDDFVQASDIQSQILAIREQTFRKCFDACNSSDVAGYVSDDFEIIAKSQVLGLDGPLLQQLRVAYDRCTIPPHTISEYFRE
jgi:hypothetical protein